MTKSKSPFVNRLTLASKDVVEERIKESLEASGFVQEDARLKRERVELERRMSNVRNVEERKVLELQIADNKRKTVSAQPKRNVLVTRSVQAQAKMASAAVSQ